MDNVTHTLIGANLANAIFKKRLGPQTVPILCWASNLPDLDVAVLALRDPLKVTLRRTWGHSVFTLPLLVGALAWFFKKKYPSQRWGDLLLMCAVGAGVHVGFDLVNSFGVRLTWPFTAYRPELAIVFIIDLFLLALLAFPFLVPRGDRTKLARLSMGLVLAYIALCEASRLSAQRLLSPLAQGADFSYVFPEPLGPHRWRGVARRGNEYAVYLLKPWTAGAEARGFLKTDLDAPAVAQARATPEARRLEAFFKAPVWQRDAPGLVRVSDLRFRSLVLGRAKSFEFTFENGRLR